jgi:Cu/Ag efflux pump CusA
MAQEERGSTTREIVEHKIKKAISARSPMKRNLIVRMPDELHNQLEEIAQKMTKEMPGKRVTVSDVARILLEHGVRLKKAGPHKRAEILERNSKDI